MQQLIRKAHLGESFRAEIAALEFGMGEHMARENVTVRHYVYERANTAVDLVLFADKIRSEAQNGRDLIRGHPFSPAGASDGPHRIEGDLGNTKAS